MYIYIQAYKRTNIQKDIRAYMHTYIHTYIHVLCIIYTFVICSRSIYHIRCVYIHIYKHTCTVAYTAVRE